MGQDSTVRATPREQEVLELLVEGLTNRAIAERLVVSEVTVREHVSNPLVKFNAQNRTELTATYLRLDQSHRQHHAGA